MAVEIIIAVKVVASVKVQTADIVKNKYLQRYFHFIKNSVLVVQVNKRQQVFYQRLKQTIDSRNQELLLVQLSLIFFLVTIT